MKFRVIRLRVGSLVNPTELRSALSEWGERLGLQDPEQPVPSLERIVVCLLGARHIVIAGLRTYALLPAHLGNGFSDSGQKKTRTSLIDVHLAEPGEGQPLEDFLREVREMIDAEKARIISDWR